MRIHGILSSRPSERSEREPGSGNQISRSRIFALALRASTNSGMTLREIMIGRLRGILIEKQPPILLVDVAGIAYEVFASMQTFYQLSPV